MSVLYQIGRSVAFRKVAHRHLKWFTSYIPAACAGIGGVVFLMLPIEPALFGASSLTHHVISFVTTLPGFFIAALAAVATFQRTNLDEIMPAPTPTLVMRTRGADEAVELTMRMFLTHMFAYLTALSFLTALFCIVADLVAPNVTLMVDMVAPWNALLENTLQFAYVLIVVWLVSSIVCTSLYGLYFLGERMHRPHS